MKTKTRKQKKDTLAGVGPALRRAALVARKTARMYGTSVYFIRDGKIVAEKPQNDRRMLI
jgi:hypothetical protein